MLHQDLKTVTEAARKARTELCISVDTRTGKIDSREEEKKTPPPHPPPQKIVWLDLENSVDVGETQYSNIRLLGALVVLC